MITLLLVDDESRTVRGLQESIPWRDLGIDTVLTATNGADALAIAADRPIDILLTDIRMPRMDGVTLARQVAEFSPDTVIVFLTAISQFEYAKAAVAVGAIDYLLKPVDTGEVIDVISRAVDEVHRCAAGWVEGGGGDNSAVEAAVLERRVRSILTQSQPKGVSGAEAAQTELGSTTSSPGLVVVVVIDGESDREFDTTIGANVVRGIEVPFDESCVLALTRQESMIYVRFASTIDPVVAVDSVFAAAIRSADDSASGAAEHPVRIGISHTGARENDVRGAYDRARRAAALSIHFPGRRVHRYNESFDHCSNEWETVRSRIGSTRARGTTAMALAIVPIVGSLVGQLWFTSTHFAELKRLVAHFMAVAAITDSDAGAEEADWLVDRVGTAHTLAELMECIETIGRGWHRQSPDDPKAMPTIDRILRFIDENLDRSIGLAEVAESVELTPSYVSALFHRATGESVVRRITRLKIDRAKDMLSSAGHGRVSDISARLGYTDYRYFTRVFKQHTGVTPTEYARQDRGWS